jgi:hypothetical protein
MSLNQLLQFGHHRIDLFPGIVLAKGKAYCHLVGVIIDGAYYVRPLFYAAGTGTPAGCADTVNVKIE